MSLDFEDTKRTSMTFTKKAHQRLNAICKQLGLTQPEVINLVLENISLETVRPLAEPLRRAKEAERKRDTLLREKLKGLNAEQIERMLAAIETPTMS